MANYFSRETTLQMLFYACVSVNINQFFTVQKNIYITTWGLIRSISFNHHPRLLSYQFISYSICSAYNLWMRLSTFPSHLCSQSVKILEAPHEAKHSPCGQASDNLPHKEKLKMKMSLISSMWSSPLPFRRCQRTSQHLPLHTQVVGLHCNVGNRFHHRPRTDLHDQQCYSIYESCLGISS